jgi:hypothetical protein
MTAFTKMKKVADEDIYWFFGCAHADCGFSSNWNSFLSACMYGSGEQSIYQEHMNDNIFESVRRWRAIRVRLSKLTNRQYSILYHTFADPPLQHDLNKVFMHLSGAALHTNLLPHNELLRLVHKIAIGKPSEQERQLAITIKKRAEQDYREAVISYYRIR